MIGVGHFAAAAMDIRESANRREVFRCAAQDLLELRRRLVELTDFNERAAERDPRGDYEGCRRSPARQASIASPNIPMRRYSSASAAKEIDAGSRWTRRLTPESRVIRHRHRDTSTITGL